MREVSRKSLLLLGLMVLLIMLPMAMLAQSTTEGAIGGTVTDVTGAVVPNAAVKVRNTGTNAELTATTDASGYFRVIRLQPAPYEVTITAQGFAAFKATNVVVNVGSITELLPKLKPAGATETVEVLGGAAPQVNTTSSEFAPVVGETAIKNLPINGGRWSNFVLLTPGVVNSSDGFGLVSFRGMSTLQNNNTIDGADNNQAFFSEERGRTRAAFSTPKAAIQEFQVNTSNYSTEYGRAVGGVINTVTKSGTNSLHGEAYFYDRDNNWGATNPFATITEATSTAGVYNTHPYKPKDWRKMIGAGIGGPIVKDKLFFHFAYDFTARKFPGLGVAYSPKSFFATPSAANFTMLATRLGTDVATATSTYNTAMTNYLTTGGPNDRDGVQYVYLPKIDWQVNPKHHVSFVVNRMVWDSYAGMQTQSTNTYGRQSFGSDYVRVTWGVFKLSSTLTNNLVNEIRVQYGRDFAFVNTQVPTTYEQNTIMKNSLYAGYANPFGNAPEVQMNNGWTIGSYYGLPRNKYPDERRQQYADTMSWAKGKHMFKFGGDVTHAYDDSASMQYGYGSFNYGSSNNSTGFLDYVTDLNIVPGTRNALNQLLGCTYTSGGVTKGVPCYASNYQQTFGPLQYNFATADYGLFAEDSWRIMPRLTLTLGLRYDFQQMPNVYEGLGNPAVPETFHLPRDVNNLGPRAGFAWDVFGDGKTSLRGGYALTFGRTINSTIYKALTTTGMTGAQFTYQIGNSSTCAPSFPKVYASLADLPAGCSAGKSVVYFDHDYQQPKVHHVNLSIDRQLTSSTVLQLSYLGSFGRNLPIFVDKNIDPASMRMNTFMVCGSTLNPGTTTTSADPATCGKPGAGQPIQTATYTAPVYTARLNAAYGQMTDVMSVASSTYHALVAQVNRRMTKHFQYNANFTWSHAIDDGQNSTTFSTGNGVLDPFNLKAERGNSSNNVPLRFVFSAVMESPWKFNGLFGRLMNDWQIAPMWQWQSGLPYKIGTSSNASSCAACAQPLGYFTGGGGMNGTGGDYRIYGGRNARMMPATQLWDMKLSKNFKFTERFSSELSAEGFNLFNHVNYTSINSTAYYVGTATVNGSTVRTLSYNQTATPYGALTNANSNFAYKERQIQLGVKVKF